MMKYIDAFLMSPRRAAIHVGGIITDKVMRARRKGIKVPGDDIYIYVDGMPDSELAKIGLELAKESRRSYESHQRKSK